VRGSLKAGYLPDGVVSIYTVSGETVIRMTPVNGWFEWNGKTGNGENVAPGIYYYVAKKGDEVIEKGVLLIRRGGS
jgi:flagellar hook assembly protein FlgD